MSRIRTKLLIILIVVISFLFESCITYMILSSLSSNNANKDILYTQSKESPSSDEAFVHKDVAISYSKFKDLLAAVAEKGYSLENYYKSENGFLNKKNLLIICNIISELEGLQPAYLTKDGVPLKKTNELDDLILTDPLSGGWYLPIYYANFEIKNINTTSDNYNLTSSNFKIGGAFDFYTYYSATQYSSSFTYYSKIQFTIERTKNSSQYELQTKNFDGKFQNGYYISPFFATEISTPLLLSIYANSISSQNPNKYIINESKIHSKFIPVYAKNIYYHELGINEQIFCNMLSESTGLIPTYYSLDGQIYRNSTQNYYEQHTNGWRSPTSRENRIISEKNLKGDFLIRNQK